MAPPRKGFPSRQAPSRAVHRSIQPSVSGEGHGMPCPYSARYSASTISPSTTSTVSSVAVSAATVGVKVR